MEVGVPVLIVLTYLLIMTGSVMWGQRQAAAKHIHAVKLNVPYDNSYLLDKEEFTRMFVDDVRTCSNVAVKSVIPVATDTVVLYVTTGHCVSPAAMTSLSAWSGQQVDAKTVFQERYTDQTHEDRRIYEENA